MDLERLLERPGMPPLFLNVLDSKTLREAPDKGIKELVYWVAGEQPHLGRVIDGYTGTETVVLVYINGDYIRLNRDFDLPTLNKRIQELPNMNTQPIQIYPSPELLEPAA